MVLALASLISHSESSHRIRLLHCRAAASTLSWARSSPLEYDRPHLIRLPLHIFCRSPRFSGPFSAVHSLSFLKIPRKMFLKECLTSVPKGNRKSSSRLRILIYC